MSRRRVVVTGLGVISPVGNTVPEAWENLIAGKSGIGPITRFDASNFASRIAGEVKGFDVSAYLSAKEARRMDVFIHYGMAAGIQAIRESGIEVTEANADRIGVNIGSGIGGLPMIEETHDDFLGGGPRKISPFFIPGTIINMISGNLSIMFGMKGPNLSIVTACTTGLHTIGMSARMIEYGDADVMVCGGAESTVTNLAIGGFASAKALSTRNDDPATASRPWDKDRDGFVLGEGAGVMVVEEYEHAVKRGAKIYAELSGFGMSGDAYHMTAPDTDGPRRSMLNAMKNAGVNPDQVHYLNAHGTSTPAWRQERNRRDQARFRRGQRPQAGGQFHQVDDRTPARRCRWRGIGVLRARRSSSDFAADDQHLRAGSGMRSGLLRKRGTRDEDRRGDEEQLRLRRHQRHAGFPPDLNSLAPGAACSFRLN